MLKILVIALLLVIAAILIYAATKPNTFRIQRSANLRATPERIFALLNDFHQWEAWSPWEKIDPQIKRTYSGAASGKGAIYEWNGNKNVGQGRMEILESSPSSRMLIKIDFITPMEAHNTIEFALERQGDSTTVTQAMYGPNPYISKLMSIFLNMEKMIGPKFEEGFASLKALTEK